ncbi:MAG: zinc ribbon domain-containing protein [Lachnospiraceae bacterium]|nr:zinc ribbon domain-containing protein [Lachnospiraceae bacterium]
MRYCSSCGALNDTDAKFCSGCGKQFENAPEEIKSDYSTEQFITPEPPVYGPPEDRAVFTYQQPENTYAPQQTDTLPPKARVFGILSFIFGLFSVAWSWTAVFPGIGLIFGFVFLAMAIVGMIFGSKSQQMSSFRLAKAGKVLCIIGLIFVIICMIIGIIVLVYAIQNGGIDEFYSYFDTL